MNLYRPVGLHELALIYQSGCRAFPARLPEQPIFYPVLNLQYAAQIAREWNTKSNSVAGYVTHFTVADTYAQQYERQVVGQQIHEELQISAEHLPYFNRQLTSPITVIAAYFGGAFQGKAPAHGPWQGLDARMQLDDLLRQDDREDTTDLVSQYNEPIYLHWLYWCQTSSDDPRHSAVLAAVQQHWEQQLPDLPLPTS